MRFKGTAPAWIALLLALSATALATKFIRDTEYNEARSAFERRAEAVAGAIGDTMAAYFQVLRSGVGLFNASGHVMRTEFRDFVRSLEIDASFPGIQGIGYSKILKPEDIAAHVTQQRADGIASYRFNPDGVRPSYSAITYLEPQDWRNERALGFDMLSEANRRVAMERARDTGAVALTAKVTLVQETDKDVQAGTLIYLPIFKSADSPSAVEQRRSDLVGYIYGVFRMRDLIGGIVQKHTPNLLRHAELAVYDGNHATAEQLLFNSDADPGVDGVKASASPAPLFQRDEHMDVAGRNWLVRVSTDASQFGEIDRSRSQIVTLLGSLVSLLIFAIVHSVSAARQRSEVFAAQLADEVSARRAAQDQLDIVNRELLHRVKNTLAVVQGMMHQTILTSPSLDAFSEGFGKRLQSLARSHELLVQSDWRGVPIEDLVRSQIEFTGGGTAFIVSGPLLRLTDQSSQHLGLALHELATNSLKHGALAARSGHIRITWSIDEPGKTVRFEWSEDVTGLSEAPPKRSGFGRFVLDNVVPRSLDGTAETRYDANGLCWSLSFPSSHCVQDAPADAPGARLPGAGET